MWGREHLGADFIFSCGWDCGDGSVLEEFPMEHGIIVFLVLCFFLKVGTGAYGWERGVRSIWGYLFFW